MRFKSIPRAQPEKISSIMEYKDSFEKEILTRTLDIWNDYKGPYEETLFLNLCVGLLIIPKESLYAKLPTEDVSLSVWSVEPSWITFEKNDDRTVRTIVRHIRNAIAHNRIGFENRDMSGTDITHIHFEDKSSGKLTFKVVMEMSKFRDFVLKVANFALQSM